MTEATDLAAAAGSADPRVGLRAVVALRRLLEGLGQLQVAAAPPPGGPREPQGAQPPPQGLVLAGDRRRARGDPPGRTQETCRSHADAGFTGGLTCSSVSP